MIPKETTMKMLRYSDKILEVIDQKDELSRGDLQGAIEAIVLTILAENQK